MNPTKERELPTSVKGYRHTCNVTHAEKFLNWIEERGGVAVWLSADLSDPGKSWSSPALTDGQPTQKPSWQSADAPVAVITDPTEIGVMVDEEVKRFHVDVRRGSQGLSLKCTDAGSRRIRREVARAGEGAYYEFDYGTQEAVIMKPSRMYPLTEYRAEPAQPTAMPAAGK
jgi:hypothetical protein